MTARSQLATRLISAAVMLGLAVAITIFAKVSSLGPVIVVAAVFVLCGVSAFEMARLFSRDARTLRYQPYRGSAVFVGMIMPLAGAVWSSLAIQSLVAQPVLEPFVASLALGICVLCTVMCWAGRFDIEEAAAMGKGLGFGALYLVGGSSAMITIAGLPGSVGYIWWLVGAVALGDTAAYFVGKSFGGPKVAPALSPNKTVSGSVGGLCASAISGLIFWRPFVDSHGSVLLGLAVGLAVGFAAQIGDLTKSYLKRLRGVKDFGAIIPGHGGVLDRCDGFFGGSCIFLAALWAIR